MAAAETLEHDACIIWLLCAELVAIALNMIAGRDDVVPNQVIALSAAGQFEALSKTCSGVSMLL